MQLYGPLAAWGEQAVGGVRRSATHPSKSAILGLCAAAQGIRRDEETAHLNIRVLRTRMFSRKRWQFTSREEKIRFIRGGEA